MAWDKKKRDDGSDELLYREIAESQMKGGE